MMQHDTSHLDAIDLRLSHERVRASEAKTKHERDWREHNVRMIELERHDEIAFLAKHGVIVCDAPATMTIDEIFADMAELGLIQPSLPSLKEWKNERRETDYHCRRG